MKTLIVHAGTYKTGSTSLQLFLFDNEQLLREKGVGVFRPRWMYPRSQHDSRDTHPEHTAMFLRKHFNIESGGFRDYSAPLQERVLESDAHNMRDFERFVQEHDTVVVSEEGSYFVSNEYWQFLHRHSSELGFDRVQVVVYLRRQDEYLSSLYLQDVQTRRTVDYAVDAPTKKDRLFDYNACIFGMEAALGHESIIVRGYDRDRLVGGDVRLDFCDAIGIGWDERFVLRENLNPSISLDVAEAKRLANLSPSYSDSDDYMYDACDWVSKVLPDQPRENLLSSEEARQMMELYEEGNRAISERFFGGEPLFDEVEDGTVGWKRDTDRVLDASVVLLTEALSEQKGRADELEGRLERLERLLLIPQLRKAKRWVRGRRESR